MSLTRHPLGDDLPRALVVHREHDLLHVASFLSRRLNLGSRLACGVDVRESRPQESPLQWPPSTPPDAAPARIDGGSDK